MRRFALILVLVAVTLPAAAETTQPTKQECVSANEAAQDLRRSGRLHGARQKLLLCMSDSCPKAVRDDCAQQLGEVDKALADTEEPSSSTQEAPPVSRVQAQQQQGDVGDTCAKRSDCKDGLRCRNEKCSSEDQEPQRRAGLGLGFGGGIAAGTLRVIRTLDDTNVTPEILLSTIELSWYLPGEHAISLYVPFFNNVIGCGLAKGFVWNMDVMFTFNIGSGAYRFVAGPGIGFTTLLGQVFSDGPSVAGIGLRIPGELAFEHIWDHKTWGIKFAARPWIEIATERVEPNSTVNTTGVGLVGMFVLSRFSTKASP